MKRMRSKTSPGSISDSRVSSYRVQELRRDIAVMSRARKFGSEELDRMLIRLEEIALQFFGALPGGDGRAQFHGPRGVSANGTATFTRIC